ncbi:MAG: hypothetical protein ABIT96_00200 [Ferruginibacter sp.]
MQKLDTIIKVFSRRQDVNFQVVFELSSYKRIPQILAKNKYDSSLITLMSSKYYPVSNKIIQTKLPQKAFKSFNKELRLEFQFAQNSCLDAWVGSALIFKNEKLLITDAGLDKNELILKIENSLITIF